MNSIQEIASTIIKVMEVALNAWGKQKELFPLKDTVHQLQLSAYWLKSAQEELTQSQDNELSHGESIKPPKILGTQPTMIKMDEHFRYIKTNLEQLYQDITTYTETTPLSPTVVYKIQRSNDKIMEAIFNNDLATNFYNQIKTHGTN